jgi:hypothetical protein
VRYHSTRSKALVVRPSSTNRCNTPSSRNKERQCRTRRGKGSSVCCRCRCYWRSAAPMRLLHFQPTSSSGHSKRPSYEAARGILSPAGRRDLTWRRRLPITWRPPRATW